MLNTANTLAYIFATAFGLFSAYLLNKANPNLHPVTKFFIVPFLVIYVVYKILQFLFQIWAMPELKLKDIFKIETVELNSIGYVEIFPPLFAVFIILIILLYTGFF